MKTVLAAAVLSLCLAFAGHAAELHLGMYPVEQASGCIQHNFVRINDNVDDQNPSMNCAQFLATNRVVQSRRIQHT